MLKRNRSIAPVPLSSKGPSVVARAHAQGAMSPPVKGSDAGRRRPLPQDAGPARESLQGMNLRGRALTGSSSRAIDSPPMHERILDRVSGWGHARRLIQSRRDEQTAKRLLRKLLKRQMRALTGAGTSAPGWAIVCQAPRMRGRGRPGLCDGVRWGRGLAAPVAEVPPMPRFHAPSDRADVYARVTGEIITAIESGTGT